MRKLVYLIFILLTYCSHSNVKTNTNSIKIIVNEFNDFNGRNIDSLRGFFKYSDEFIKSDSVKSYGLTILIDTTPNDSTLYAFINETQNGALDWTILGGLKVEHLNPSQIDHTCNNICTSPTEIDVKYFAIIEDFIENKQTAKIFKAYKLDFYKKKFIETSKDSLKCEVLVGED